MAVENEGTPVDPGYDPSTMGDIVSEGAFDESPGWMKERFGRFSKKNRELENQARDKDQQLIAALNQIQVLEKGFQQDTASDPVAPTPQFSEADLLAAVEKYDGYQRVLMDPNVDEETRMDASRKLRDLPPGTLAKVYKELADLTSKNAVSELRSELEERAQKSSVESAAMQKLFSTYGQDAVNPNSALAQKALEKLKSWQSEFGLTGQDVGGFVTAKAFEEASQELKREKSRGGRDSDPRRLAVGAPGERGSGVASHIAALKGDSGDWKAARDNNTAEVLGAMQNWMGQTRQ